MIASLPYAMTREDWEAICVRQGFSIEVRVATPIRQSRSRNAPTYGECKRMAVLYLDTNHGLSRVEFCNQRRFSRKRLMYAIKNLRQERRHGYRRRHKSQRKPGSTYGTVRPIAADFLDHPEKYGHNRAVCAAQHGMLLEPLSSAIRALRGFRQRGQIVRRRAA